VAAAHFSGENGPREDYWSDVVSEIRLDESKFSSATIRDVWVRLVGFTLLTSTRR